MPGPKIITPGNHDTPMFGLLHRALDPFGRYNEAIEPLSEKHYADQNVSIVKMNTARGMQFKLDWSLGVVDIDELHGHVKQLHGSKPRVLKFLACHHPFVYPKVSPLQRETENGATAIQILSDNNIDSVLSGHVHAPFFVDRMPGDTGVISIGSGTLSTRSRGADASFNHINISADDITVTPITWTGDAYIAGQQWRKNRTELEPSPISERS
ncbi:MAG: metallophosphoesterase [Acidimicrobiales bacterium]|nr:MAG: metallophosphoesterase [Acidimicrobiales bacterium]